MTIATSISSIRTLAAVLSHAQVFDPKQWNTLMSQADLNQLIAAVEQLFDDLSRSGVPYLLVGGIAMLTYIEGRNTQDIDLIMGRGDLNELAAMEITDEDKNFIRANYQGLQVDLLLTQNPLFEQVQQQYKTEIKWGEQRLQIPCATPEGLVILKLYALPSLYRQGRFDRAALYETDILQLVYNYQISLAAAIAVVDPHVIDSDRSELRSIVQDIEQRITRMKRASESSNQPDR